MTNYTEKIVKIGENNVEVHKVLFDEDGKEVIIETESYGGDKINHELESAENNLTRLSKITATQYKATEVKEHQDTKDKMILIQAEMDKELR